MITVYSKENCSYCTSAIKYLTNKNVYFVVKKMGTDVTREWILETFPTMKTMPIITKTDFEGTRLIGGYDDLLKYEDSLYANSDPLVFKCANNDMLYMEANCGPNPGKA